MTENARTIDHDRLFKGLISVFFWQFLQLFFPEVAQYVDPNSIQFLSEELLNDVTEGEKKESRFISTGKIPGKIALFHYPY